MINSVDDHGRKVLAPLCKCAVHLGAEAHAVKRMKVLGKVGERKPVPGWATVGRCAPDHELPSGRASMDTQTHAACTCLCGLMYLHVYKNTVLHTKT